MRERKEELCPKTTKVIKPVFGWQKARDGDGKILIFNGPGLLEHAEREHFQIPPEAVDVLKGYLDETVAENFSPDDIDWLFIVGLAAMIEDTNNTSKPGRVETLIEKIKSREPKFQMIRS